MRTQKKEITNKYKRILGIAAVVGAAGVVTTANVHADMTAAQTTADNVASAQTASSVAPSTSSSADNISSAPSASDTESSAPSSSAPSSATSSSVAGIPESSAPSLASSNTAQSMTVTQPEASSAPASSVAAPATYSGSYTVSLGDDTDNSQYQATTTPYITTTSNGTAQFNKITSNVPTLKTVDSTNVQAFIKSIAPRVTLLAGQNNLYASIIIAQAILESGYGTSYIASDYHNLFNITGSYQGQSVSVPGIGAFRAYPNYDDSLVDYINLMLNGTDYNKKLYAGTWKSNNDTYVKAITSMNGIFATDPNYVTKVIDLIKTYNLTQYDDTLKSLKAQGFKAAATAADPKSPVLSALQKDSQFPAWDGVEQPGSGSYAWGNCTQYAYNRILQLGGHIGQYLGNGGDWGANAAAQGYFTSHVPAVGYAVSFPAGVAGASADYGHVAFVEKVYNDGSILISEMNATAGLGKVDYRQVSAADAVQATYIQPKK